MMFIEEILVLSECLLQIYNVSINKSLKGGNDKWKKVGIFSITIYMNTYIYQIAIQYQTYYNIMQIQR